MAKSNANNPVLLTIAAGSLTTDGTVIPAFYLPRKFVLLSAKLLNGANIAASDSNFCTLTLKVGTTAFASLDTRAANQGAVTLNVGLAFAVAAAYDNGSHADEPVEAGNVTLTYAETGTVALTNSVVQLYGYWK